MRVFWLMIALAAALPIAALESGLFGSHHLAGTWPLLASSAGFGPSH